MRFLRGSGSLRMWAVVCPLVVACGGSSFTLGNGDGGAGDAGSSSGADGSSGSSGAGSSGGGSSSGASSSGASSSGASSSGASSSGGSSSGTASSSGGTSSSGSSSGTASSSVTTGDSGSGDASPACAPLGASDKDVYVDQRFTGSAPTGTKACPFPTILAGIGAAGGLKGGTITVHVAGATPALVYAEAGPVDVASNFVLQGDGAAATTITASGTCGSTTCAVGMAGGATIDGFTVTCSGGDGIAIAAGNTAATVSHVTATGSKGNGIITLGSVNLGPGLAANGNGAAGVESPQGATGVVHVGGAGDSFDDNTGNGIDLSGAAVLNFEGGSASGNAQGIRLAGTASTGTSAGHSIASLVAQKNTGPGGVVAYNGQTLKVRSSTLTGNAGVGLLYNYANGSTLDIGSANSPGNNVFGGATGNNAGAGLRLCGVALTGGSQNAGSDSWSVCPPVQTFLACDTAPTTYSDIIYSPALTVGTPVNVTGCAVGP